MKQYMLGDQSVDSVELKCLVVSRGLLVDPQIYERFSPTARVDPSPLACNCFLLSDGTVIQLTDLAAQLRHLTRTLAWSEVLSTEFARKLGTPFSMTVEDGVPVLCHQGAVVDTVSFLPKTDFYRQKTAHGLPFIGNSVLQGRDWVAFQCLWPCEHAAAGKGCQYCFSGGEFEALTRAGKPLPKMFPAEAAAEIAAWAVEHDHCCGIQVTGGSTFSETREAGYINAYLEAIGEQVPAQALHAGILLYTTPPTDHAILDGYLQRGVRKVACSLEVWDEARANVITPGKMQCSTRRQHLDALQYVAERYGSGRAFSNFIIGLESYETLKEGATYLAERNILPSASVWMPMGRPVMGSMTPPDLTFFRRVKELFADLYIRYGLEPGECSGLNVCIEQDIWNYAASAQACSCGACAP